MHKAPQAWTVTSTVGLTGSENEEYYHRGAPLLMREGLPGDGIAPAGRSTLSPGSG
jgi:hypothetical protein